MKAGIHPKYHSEAKVSCACGNTFTVGATFTDISVDVCSACHPFYTGTMKFVDTAGRVDAFRSKQASAAKKVLSKTEKRALKRQKRAKKEQDLPGSLEDLRSKN